MGGRPNLESANANSTETKKGFWFEIIISVNVCKQMHNKVRVAYDIIN